ncbi:MAG: ferredoxin--nitrite reductase [Ardenticatenia bacterium]|nr:MAG: ferredoxin--nitrite reductase [Ardenticatenia bacterium]
MSKKQKRSIEELKADVGGFEAIWARVMQWAAQGWEAIPEDERDLLKWYGVFYRPPTPGYFMIRVRVPGGVLQGHCFTATQWRTLADITRDYGRDVIDITTRQQVQLRWIRMEHVPEVLARLQNVGLTTMQTGHDNVRNVTTCPVAGLTDDEVFDTRPLVQAITDAIVGNWRYADIPRKFNITIIGCRDNCTHAETNDIAFTPALQGRTYGFNVWVGGAMGSWGTQRAWPLDIFVEPSAEQVVPVCLAILDIFRERGNRQKRKKARLKFVIDEMGIAAFREEVIARLPFTPKTAGCELTHAHAQNDHIGLHRQKNGRYYVGLNVTTGRLTLDEAYAVANLAEQYGTGEIRLTPEQNIVIPHVEETNLPLLFADPLTRTLSPNPLPFRRGLVACTGNTYCPFALIETKDRTRELVEYLDAELGEEVKHILGTFHIHASGCPNACGRPHTGQIGLIGKKIRVNGEIVEGVDIYIGGEPGLFGAFNERWQKGVPCAEAGPLIASLVREYMQTRFPGETFHVWCLRKGLISGANTHYAPMIHDLQEATS